jgi:aspartyl-tRNA(Asn)/glutamyl-tRNA(Gln) amidotransferase subunit A
LSGADVIRDWIEVGRWRAKMKTFMESYDLLLTPTTAVPAFPNGLMDNKVWPGMVHWSLTPFTPLFNFTHNPAATIPCGFTSERLPVGLHIVGRLQDELTILKASRAFEEAKPWAALVPPVS